MSEKNLDFDTVIDRYNTNSLKFDAIKARKKPSDITPLWVADMDFKISSYIQEAINKQTEHGIFGYSFVDDEYYEVLEKWFKNQYNYEVKKNHTIQTPGIVLAISVAINSFSKEGEGVLIQTPVYYPFKEVIEDTKRKVVDNRLKVDDKGKYSIDFDDFEEKIINEKVKLFILSNPHNPVGRVWKKEELIKLGKICLKHKVLVVSDEIHADFVFEGSHIVFAGISKEFEGITITCTSPSKTFNLAGLQFSNIFISNATLRNKFKKTLNSYGYSQPNIIGLIACKAAYKDGYSWYKAVYNYIKANIEFVNEYIKNNIKDLKVINTQGTYLVWIDFKNLNMSKDKLEDLIVNKAKLWLDNGEMFGETGVNYQRINVATSRKVLEKSLESLKKALNNII